MCSIEVNATERTLQIRFINTGIVISPKDLEHIFEPFYRSENAKKEKGHGIGLYLTEKIIHLHNAVITVTSDNKATIFTVIFTI